MRLCWLMCVLLLAKVGFAQELPIPAPPQVGASGVLLMDFRTGELITESNADERLEPASLTKLMTGYVVFKALDDGLISLDDEVFVSEKAWRTGGSRTYIEVDSYVPVEVLIKGMIIQSGNDASVALAEHVAGSEASFADLMNKYAAQLGMTNSHFVNSTGLPATDHYSTARDSATVARAIISEFPDYYSFYSMREFEYNEIKQPNRNNLLWRDQSVDGLKTGYTEAAGYCLVSSAQRDGMRLIAVVMGAESADARLVASQALLNYGFRFFETRKLYSAGDQVAESRVWKGQSETVAIGVAEDVYITAPRGRADSLSAVADISAQLIAPLAASTPVGDVNISFSDELKMSVPLVTLNAVDEAGLWTRMLDEISLWFE